MLLVFLFHRLLDGTSLSVAIQSDEEQNLQSTGDVGSFFKYVFLKFITYVNIIHMFVCVCVSYEFVMLKTEAQHQQVQ